MNLNKVILVGRLTADPEVRSTPSGQSVATIRMATNRVWHDRNTNQKQEATEFHTVIAWGRLAEISSQYLKKGALAMFEGRLQTRNWVGQDNIKRYTTEVVAETLQMGPRAAGSSFSGPSEAPSPRPTTARRASSPVQDESPIPIINEDELTTQGVDEAEVPLKDDLPF